MHLPISISSFFFISGLYRAVKCQFTLEVSLLNEGLGAEVTFERPVIGVSPGMLLQGRSRQETQTTVNAEMFPVSTFQIFRLCVHRAHVVVDVGLLDKALAADGALVGTRARVDEQVLLQGGAAAIRAATDRTRELALLQEK